MKNGLELPVKRGAVYGRLDKMVLIDETQVELSG